MALLAAEGALTPMPTAAVFADTKAEPASVYRWLDWLTPRLPFPVYRVTAPRILEEEETRIRRSGKTGHLYRRSLIPAYLDRGAPAFRHCTQEFKLRPLWREYRRLAGITPQRRTPEVTQWIGISLDECGRMKPSRKRWLVNRWPLIYDLPMTRSRCRQWFEKRGLPQPPRSACRFCPYHNDAEWARLKRDEPFEFASAVAFERRVQDTCASVGQSKVFFHRSLKPLDLVALEDSTKQPDLFGDECEGMCGV